MSFLSPTGVISQKKLWQYFCALLFLASAGVAQGESPQLIVVRQFDEPILTIHSPGAQNNKYGFEGGRVLKLNGTYHLFTSEMIGDPHWVKMKLAHWTSHDRLRWDRAATLFESSGDFTGADPRAAVWAPMPVYNSAESRWNLFYVAYRSAPDTAKEWLTNYEGQIWRAVSKVKGPDGVGGPYEDAGVILRRDQNSDTWEGLQGTDSFFPYKVGKHWYAFYGTGHTEKLPISLWQVGLAYAAGLAGPWKRRSDLNPLNIEKVFIENPIVTRVKDGPYIAVYDNNVDHAIGYTFASDGIHWAKGRSLVVQQGKGLWAAQVRTPLGLIPETENRFTLFYSGNQNEPDMPADSHGIPLAPGAIGLVDIRLER